MQHRVNALFSRDYEITTIDNSDGSYCSSYPLELVVLEREKAANSRRKRGTRNSQQRPDSESKGGALPPKGSAFSAFMSLLLDFHRLLTCSQ